MMHKHTGFSLIELMIVLVIISIIASFAVPSYLSQIRASKRTDALASLINLQTKQEIWRTDHTQYTDDLSATGLNVNATSIGGDYTLSITNQAAYTYTAVATAKLNSGQVLDVANGISCKILTITQDNTRSPAVCWSK